MDHVARVRGRQRLQQLARDLARARGGQRAVVEGLLERLPLQQLHRDEHAAARRDVRVVDSHDVAVVEAADDPHLVEEQPRGRAGDPGRQHLDRDIAPDQLLVGAIDDAEAAARDLRLDPEPSRERGPHEIDGILVGPSALDPVREIRTFERGGDEDRRPGDGGMDRGAGELVLEVTPERSQRDRAGLQIQPRGREPIDQRPDLGHAVAAARDHEVLRGAAAEQLQPVRGRPGVRPARRAARRSGSTVSAAAARRSSRGERRCPRETRRPRASTRARSLRSSRSARR